MIERGTKIDVELDYLRKIPDGRGSPLALGARRFDGCRNPDGFGIVPVVSVFFPTCFISSAF